MSVDENRPVVDRALGRNELEAEWIRCEADLRRDGLDDFDVLRVAGRLRALERALADPRVEEGL